MKSHSEFKNKNIAVLGLGMEGYSSAVYLSKLGAKVTVLDHRSGEDLEGERVEALEKKGIEILAGSQFPKTLEGYDALVRSPGVRRDSFEIFHAEQKETEVTSQTKIFFDLASCPIIGVTGTKGKGTTSSLIYEMLKKEGRDAYLGGNIGKPPFEFLDKLNTQSIVVLELSSFQLLDLTKSPHIGVMLMTTSEHLNYHKDIDEYVDAKRNIIRFQTKDDFAILNRDYPASNESDVHTAGKIYHVSRERDVPTNGCFVKDGVVWVRENAKDKKIIDVADVLLPGKHNLENVCAASMAAYLAGVSIENIAAVLKTFKGLEHRLELVDTINAVRYYDDSFSTTPETAIAAIHAFKEPEILILGGSSKNSNFEELGQVISKAKNIKAIIGIGEEWQKIREKIDASVSILLIEGAENMQQVVSAASKIALEGDVVLLSPACASFGMFENYKDRGDKFKEEVKRLKEEPKLNLLG